ncbi:O-antigen ligase family protein [Ruegeria arenilitoris]|uniref:O-antigen ligase family protein n=1 Tax=Ruegeria arenilitoris TaxID=1173585 RepID=UPI0014811828|nr:O-antigen ligase family protein [Ruegeria arenilitoris]
MTPVTRSFPYQSHAGSSFNHLVLAFCLCLLVVIGTHFLAIVFWQKGIANKIGVLLLVPVLTITLLYFRHLIRGAVSSPEITLLVIFAFFSVFWSDFPRHSFERAVPLVVTTALGLMLASVMSLRGLLLFLATFYGIVILLAMAAIIALPQARGIPPWGNTWNGIFLHKNGLGTAGMFALLSCSYASGQFTGKLKTVFVAAAILGLFLLIASESRSSQIIALFAVTALYVSKIMPRMETIWAIGYILFSMIFVGMVAFVLASTLAEPLFSLIGRKPTLSARIPIWELVWPNIMDRFWIGYGYAAHWYENASHLSVYSSKANLGFLPHYSHNGLLETFLNVGFVGVSLLLLGLFRFFFSMFYALRFVPHREPIVFVFILGMVFIFSNITESMVMERMSASWIFFVAYTTKMNLVAKALRATARANYVATH